MLNLPNQLFDDLKLEHEKIIWGIVFHAVQEITGKEPVEEEMEKHLGLQTFDHRKFIEWLWKGEVIVRVYALEQNNNPLDIFRKGRIVRRRRIEQPWIKRMRVIR